MSDDNALGLSRRRLLGGLSTIGAAGALGGASTLAYFSDEEQFANNRIVAGELDMKIAATNWYSDWSPDEAAHAGMADAADDADLLFPAPPDNPDGQDILIDVDEGGMDGYLDAMETQIINGGATHDNLCGTDWDTPSETVLVDLEDVKPGDWGSIGFQFELCDNPGFVWLQGDLREAAENGVNEPEGKDPQEEAGVVELLDEIQVSVHRESVMGEQLLGPVSLREFLDQVSAGNGHPLEGDMAAEVGGGMGRNCFSGGTTDTDGTHEILIVWWLPIDHGNQVQSDSVTFDLGFYTEQCRHNTGEPAGGGQQLFREGYCGTYYNLPESHPDMQGTINGPTTGLVEDELPLEATSGSSINNLNWYTPQFEVFTRYDQTLNFPGGVYPDGFFPITDMTEDGDPYHFAVHWEATIDAPSSDSYTLEVNSDDDAWVFIDGELVLDHGGVHAPSTKTENVQISGGSHELDIFFAERHTVHSALVFEPDERLSVRTVCSESEE